MAAAAFVGLNVSVKLKEPPVQLHGLVGDVKGQRLYLNNVHFLKSGKRLKDYTIHGAEIADIEVLPVPSSSATTTASLPAPTAAAPSMADGRPFHQAAPSSAGMEAVFPPGFSSVENVSVKRTGSPIRSNSMRPAQIPPASNPQTQQRINDPAILSFSRKPSAPKTAPPSSLDTQAAAFTQNIPLSPTSMLRQSHARYNTAVQEVSERNPQYPASASQGYGRSIPATQSAPVEPAEIGDNDHNADEPAEAYTVKPDDQGSYDGSRATGTKQRRRRRRKPRDKEREPRSPKDIDSSPEMMQKTQYDSKTESSGWRQTPILQSSSAGPAAASLHSTPGLIGGKVARQALASSPKKSKRQKALARESGNGWVTEDASDVHGMGDFDFEANLLQFDKRAVWDALRNGDTTADEDRLVSLNRAKPAAPGSFGGKKLLPTENVLERPVHGSQDLGFEESDENVDLGNPRLLKRNPSKSSTRQFNTRKDSTSLAVENNSSHNNNKNNNNNNNNPLQSSQANLPHRGSNFAKHAEGGGSPRFHGVASPASSCILSPNQQSGEGSPCLRYAESENICRAMAPETLEAVENLAHNGLSMSEDVLAENAGRGIAEIVLQTINPKGRRLGQKNYNSLPVVVMLVGDNKAGGRALAAARHLLERNIRVVASLPGKVDLEAGPLSSHIHRFRGKFLRSWAETSAYVKTLDAPPELIVDALLGVHSRFVDMDPAHMETAMEMVAWANKSKASVLAIDIPSGIDSSTGQVEMRQGEPAEARAKIVVCCGAPCTGLVQAMISRQNEDEWRVYIVDIGINPAARPFLRVNTSQSRDSPHRGKYIQFGNGWIVSVKYDAGVGGWA